jgi:hypothetical protein
MKRAFIEILKRAITGYFAIECLKKSNEEVN